jgi:acetyl esterase/lipase
MKASPEPSWERNISFWIAPEIGRELLCDLWRPKGEYVSGLAVIYFHGSAWYMLDKDFGTRPFFRHLVSQGHIVMDVAYRLCPEVDLVGMIGDVKRAIAWMKANASQYGVQIDKIVLAGGSAGGHLSLLAAYAPQHPELTPDELKDINLSVAGVISYYGPTDLLAVYEHTQQGRMKELPAVPIGTVSDSSKSMHDAGRLDILLGGHPEDASHAYEIGSPINHVHPGCPPTLLIQGDQDLITPVKATCALHMALIEAGVPAINLVFPCTNHAFDLLFPQLNPAAQSALYDVDRFLAMMMDKK